MTLNYPALSRLIAGLLVVCTVGWGSALFDTIKRARHSYYWDQAEGTVIWRGKMCEMSYRRDGQRRIRKADVIDCADVARYATDHPKQTWHSTDAHYVRINYFFKQSTREALFPESEIEGNNVVLYINPLENSQVDRAFHRWNAWSKRMLTIYAAVVGTLLAVAFIWWDSRSRRAVRPSVPT